jgi:hypothetical protein
MDDRSTHLDRARKLQELADEEFRLERYSKSETFYRASIELLTGVLDAWHKNYVKLLKGLLVSLEKQGKAEEAATVEQAIAQLCDV